MAGVGGEAQEKEAEEGRPEGGGVEVASQPLYYVNYFQPNSALKLISSH